MNVEYMYAFALGNKGRATMVFRFDQPDAAIEILKKSGVSVLGSVNLFRPAT